MRLQGKHALVTAAGQGIGRAIARAFVREGARVTAVDIDADALQALAREAGDALSPLPLDLTDAAAIAALGPTHADARTGFDVLVNGAGFVHAGSVLDATDAEWDFAWRLNVGAAFRLTRALLPGMLARGGGAIVNIASVASSIKGVPNRFVYGTTKAALIGLTKAVAADFVGRGVRCNAICPGTVESPSLQQRIAEQARQSGSTADAVHQAFVARQPMGRLGRPDEIAALAVYLAGDESAFVTGTCQVIDGGWAN